VDRVLVGQVPAVARARLERVPRIVGVFAGPMVRACVEPRALDGLVDTYLELGRTTARAAAEVLPGPRTERECVAPIDVPNGPARLGRRGPTERRREARVECAGWRLQFERWIVREERRVVFVRDLGGVDAARRSEKVIERNEQGARQARRTCS